MNERAFEFNWYGGGFFDLIDRYVNCRERVSSDHESTFVRVFEDSLNGSFNNIASLAGIVVDHYPSHIAKACACLIGCAGNDDLVDSLWLDKAFRVDSDRLHGLATILATHGRVSDAEKLLDVFVEEKSKGTDWFDGYPCWISDILEAKSDLTTIYEQMNYAQYESFARVTIDSISEKYGSETIVFGGLPVSPVNMKKMAIQMLEKKLFLGLSRVRLEAFFGEDCTRLYSANGYIDPVRAIETVEDFPDSPGTREGAQCFFGNPVH